jgi:hypothetical protein
VARPIKETPILTGQDALRFEEALKNSENQKVSRESYERAIKAFKSINRQSKQLIEA